MLRVRATLNTQLIGEWAQLLTTLGLVELQPQSGYREFAAAGGKIRLTEAAIPRTELGFEVRDLDKFASWTRSDGTAVELLDSGDTRSGQITGPDGLSFIVEPVEDSDPSVGAEPGLSVLVLWNTPDLPGASRTLLNIGARPDITPTSGSWAQFAAKNGGLVAAHVGAEAHAALSFEYAGEAQTLCNDLRSRGLVATLLDTTSGRSVLVPAPDGEPLWINERQQGLHGNTGPRVPSGTPR